MQKVTLRCLPVSDNRWHCGTIIRDHFSLSSQQAEEANKNTVIVYRFWIHLKSNSPRKVVQKSPLLRCVGYSGPSPCHSKVFLAPAVQASPESLFQMPHLRPRPPETEATTWAMSSQPTKSFSKVRSADVHERYRTKQSKPKWSSFPLRKKLAFVKIHAKSACGARQQMALWHNFSDFSCG